MKIEELFETVFLGSAIIKPDEPYLWRKCREKTKVWCSSYGGKFLTWEKIRSVVGDTDQMTVTYLLVSPDHDVYQDIEAIAQIYNPEGTWKRQNFDELIVEIGRMGWGEFIIENNARRWCFPQAYIDDIEHTGFLTFRVPIFH